MSAHGKSKKKDKDPATTIREWWDKLKAPIRNTKTESQHQNANAQMDKDGNPLNKSKRKR